MFHACRTDRLLGTLLLLPLVSCGDGDPVCDATCLGTLDVSFADGRTEYTVEIFGTGVSMEATCPSEAWSGNVYGLDLSCDEGLLHMEAANWIWPADLRFIVGEERWDLSPDYEAAEMCGTSCNSATISLD